MNTLPAGVHVVFPGRHHGVEEYVFVARGKLTVVAGGQHYLVGQGDTLFYPAHEGYEFRNEAEEAVVFFVIVDDTRTR